jgi:hypothetical protein
MREKTRNCDDTQGSKFAVPFGVPDTCLPMSGCAGKAPDCSGAFHHEIYTFR